MKKFTVFVFAAIVLASCKKEKDNGTGSGGGNPNVTNTPNLIALGVKPGEPFALNIWHLYDLNHDNNADKKYIRIAMASDDSARILEEPKPIDSLGSGWPANVKEVKWSSGAQFIVNNNFYLEMNGGTFRKVDYNQASPQHLWLSIHNSIPGTIELPRGEVNVSGGSTAADVQLLYFSLNGATVHTASGYRIMAFSTAFGQAFNAYSNWQDVSNFIYARTGGVSAWPTFYFFDFKNWRYWKIDKSRGLLFDWVAHPVKSLDRFLKWPPGWGKK
jgi:hypothetical protein